MAIESPEPHGHVRPGVGETHAEKWWDELHEFQHFQAWVVVALVLLTLIFDLAHHRIQHASRNLADFKTHEQQDAKKAVAAEMMKHHPGFQPLWTVLVQRATGELTVLGFLAFFVWVSKEAGLFAIIYEAAEDSEITLPDSDHAYLEEVENIHMSLFIGMLGYVVMLCCTIIVARWQMQKWVVFNTAIKKAFRDKAIVDGKVLEWAERQEPELRRFAKIRQTFLKGLEEWKGKWSFYDDTLGRLQEELQLDSFADFTNPWFPVALYLAMNYRYVMDDMIEIKPQTWLFILFSFCIHALIHRAGVAFPMCIFWVVVLAVVIIGMLIWTRLWLRALEAGMYKHGSGLCHRLNPALLVARVMQVSGFSVCFYLASGMSSKHSWEHNFDIALTSTVLATLGIPLFGIIVGYALAGLVIASCCGDFITEKNILRIAVFIEERASGEDVQQIGDDHEMMDEMALEFRTKSFTLAGCKSKGKLMEEKTIEQSARKSDPTSSSEL